MKKLPIIFFLALQGRAVAAQSAGNPASAEYLQLNACSNQYDVFSFATNQGALALLKKTSLGLYAEKRWMMEELNFCQAALGFATGAGNFGCSARYFGSAIHQEATFGLAYARKLGAVDLGLQFNYLLFGTAGYKNQKAVSMEAGMLLHLTSQLHTGIELRNPGRSFLSGAEKERLPLVLSAGFAYDLSPKFTVGALVEKPEDQPASFLAGFQYAWSDALFVRAGLSATTRTWCLGLGYQLNCWRIDAVLSLHPQLGFSPALFFLYHQNKAQ